MSIVICAFCNQTYGDPPGHVCGVVTTASISTRPRVSVPEPKSSCRCVDSKYPHDHDETGAHNDVIPVREGWGEGPMDCMECGKLVPFRTGMAYTHDCDRSLAIAQEASGLF